MVAGTQVAKAGGRASHSKLTIPTWTVICMSIRAAGSSLKNCCNSVRGGPISSPSSVPHIVSPPQLPPPPPPGAAAKSDFLRGFDWMLLTCMFSGWHQGKEVGHVAIRIWHTESGMINVVGVLSASNYLSHLTSQTNLLVVQFACSVLVDQAALGIKHA